MKLYKIKQGTKAVLLTMHESKTVTQKPWQASKDLMMTEEQLQIDPIRITHQSFDPKSLGFQLAKKGYAVFIDEPGVVNKYALAVPYAEVEVIC